MLLRCHTAFGKSVPGDEVEVPDGAVFDAYYFEPAEHPVDGPESDSDGLSGPDPGSVHPQESE